MKKFTKYLAAAVCAAFTVVACSKPENEETVDPDNGGTSDNGQEVVDPTPQTAAYKFMSATWEISASVASNAESQWVNDNTFFANCNDGANTAYVSTVGKAPNRLKNGNNICVSNMTTDDAIVFTWPGVSAAAGSTVDLMTAMYTASSSAPKYWICEFLDGDTWRSSSEDLRTATENPDLKYSFYLYPTDDQYATFAQSFTLSKDLVNQNLKFRLRVVGNYNAGGSTLTPDASAYVGFVNINWRGITMDIIQGAPAKDTKKVLSVGNSFSYYYGTAFMLKEIAESQGHAMRLRAFHKGSQYFRQHNVLEKCLAEVKDGNFDYAVLQDQSGQHALYASDPVANSSVLTETQTFFGTVLASSPSAKLILENTWAFAGSSNTYAGYVNYENFDLLLQNGTRSICAQTGATMSPIGIAFQKARAEGITDLYHTDSKHPNRNGSYLKACVNYLTIYGEKFNDNVPDLLVQSSVAARLRKIAEEVVLDGWTSAYLVLGTPDRTSFGVEGGEGSVSVSTNRDISVTTDASWISLSTSSDKVKWTVAANTDAASRTGKITISTEGLDPKEVSIFQSGNTKTGGISTAEELIDFATQYNAGADWEKYKNEDGEIVLNNDIDMTGKSWTPIGKPTSTLSVVYNDMATPTDHPFKGVFNGKGHTIKGLTMSVDIQSTQFCGLFATTSGATVENLVLDGASLTISGSGISSSHSDVGLLIGYCHGGKVSNVTVTGTIGGSAYSTASRQVGVGGICGMISNAAVVENCTMNGSITTSIEEKYSNNNTVNVGGICAGSLLAAGDGNCKITGCVNNATINVESHRAGGIISSMFYCDLEGCVNNGDITCNYAPGAISVRGTAITGVRMGGVMGYSSHKGAYASVKNCHNHGTITTKEADSVTGGMIGLIKCMSVIGCSNDGNVIGPSSAGRGLLVGIMQATTTLSTFSSCKLKGSIGTSADALTAATADNYLTNGIGATIADGVGCPTWSKENISFWE